MDVDSIGDTAGAVWRFLKENGESSMGAIERGVNEPRVEVHMAVGWLAREGKLNSREDKRSTFFWIAGH